MSIAVSIEKKTGSGAGEKVSRIVVFGDARFSAAHADYSNREMGDNYDLRDRLSQITARSLVIAGNHDAVRADKGREIDDGIADSTFVVFESSGHFAPVEEPEAFKQTVWDFLGASSRSVD